MLLLKHIFFATYIVIVSRFSDKLSFNITIQYEKLFKSQHTFLIILFEMASHGPFWNKIMMELDF